MKRRMGWRTVVLGLALISCTYGGVKLSQQAIAQDLPAEPTPDMTQSETPVPMPSPVPDVDPRLTAANTRFGFKLFSQLVQQESDKNVMISPTSVAIALSMLYNGAAGNTQAAMANALELQGLTVQDLNQANAELSAALENADPQVQLEIANSLWGRSGFSFNPEFLQQNRTFYNAEIADLDFNSPEAVQRINGWVNQNTEGKITKIIDQINPDQVLFLINAVYFKGNWTVPFNPDNTNERPFYLLDGSQKQHPMMSQQGNFAYYENDQFQAVSLPYGNRRLSMYVFLPRPDSSLTAFYNNLTAETWETWIPQFSSREGSLQLPKFKSEYEKTLNNALTALGMGVAFEEQADFSNLSTTPTAIDEVKHKTFIEVNEEGTEAAAVTSIGVRMTSINLDEPFQMVVDRPFFYAIRDNQTGTVLFMGAVVEPE
jgi:serine protease inhibitor